MDSIKTYLMIWVAGLLAGLVLVERWRRMGAHAVPAAATSATVDATMASVAPSAASPVPPSTSGLKERVAAGAKADVENFRNVLHRVTKRG